MVGINEVIKKIREIPDLTPKNLKPEDYAVPGGDADGVAGDIKKVKTTQLRKFFNKIKTLHQKAKRKKSVDDIKDIKIEILKLMPELIYAKGRGVITDEFYELMEGCLLKSEGKKRVCRFNSFGEFDNFMNFLEAVVAYHKKYSKEGG